MTEPTAAADLARFIRARVPAWTEISDEPGHWRWTDSDEDYGGRYVEIDGRLRDKVPTAEPMWGKHVGPQLLGYCKQTTVFVVLPEMVDKTMMFAAMAAMEAVDALPGRRSNEPDHARTALAQSGRQPRPRNPA